MNASLKTLQKVGLLLLALFGLTLLNGCATQPVEVPVAVPCPKYPKIDPALLYPTPSQYLLPKELQRTAPKPQ